ncbi:MAG: 2-oxoacid:acceptor oxidoreductase subunit alpha [Opitutae bacterium]|nr:2-oxoacid:acceptor oxidoreductase subunit alpha [Opitutae bacterium]
MARKTDFSVCLAGEAGQGLQSIETLLVPLLKNGGYHVFAAKEFMSRVRGGCNSTALRISSRRVEALSGAVDLFLPFTAEAVRRYAHLLSPATLVVGEAAVVKRAGMQDAPFSAIAAELGDKRSASMVATGVVAGLLGLGAESLLDRIRARFAAQAATLLDINLRAAERGLALGQDLAAKSGLSLGLPSDPSLADEMVLDGSAAIALGAVAGGCDAIFAYPMSPGTGVLAEMAQLSKEVGIVVEQAEDEIAAINMALGANYAGARAMVTTSGGGFALMAEGVSLAGITETPVVIHLAQRPGPGTGLPTRTEQGDLNLALHAGHGVFPRAIFAPGTLAQAFHLARRAFDLADEFQIPVFLLTDQYLLDSSGNVPEFPLDGPDLQRHIVEADDGYRRYRLTDSGLSPRGVPSFGPGRVCVDSDEHDESGRITEDLDGISLQMKDKRFRKFDLVRQAAQPPDRFGPAEAEILFVAWGSTGPAAREALGRLADPGAALLHFTQVWPLPRDAAARLGKAKKIVAIENSQTASFADWLRLETGASFAPPILKYNGLPFSVAELVARMKEAR